MSCASESCSHTATSPSALASPNPWIPECKKIVGDWLKYHCGIHLQNCSVLCMKIWVSSDAGHNNKYFVQLGTVEEVTFNISTSAGSCPSTVSFDPCMSSVHLDCSCICQGLLGAVQILWWTTYCNLRRLSTAKVG